MSGTSRGVLVADLPAGTRVEYKVAANGAVTWEGGANGAVTREGGANGAVTWEDGANHGYPVPVEGTGAATLT